MDRIECIYGDDIRELKDDVQLIREKMFNGWDHRMDDIQTKTEFLYERAIRDDVKKESNMRVAVKRRALDAGVLGTLIVALTERQEIWDALQRLLGLG